MLPLINGKSFLSCVESDLLVLLDNEDYRENEYIDYKLSFAFLEIEKGKEREKKKIEFKIDVCSFANADGGYLIFGIQDNNGCASAIKGIDIPNDDTDRFELDRRNDLNGIQPKIPSLKFAFIRLETGKYVVVISIKHDSFCPYIYLEEERNYRIYRRYGNGKKTMSYTELRQMFIQANSLEQSISNYLYQRIAYYRNLGNSFGNSFMYLSFIPETFSDSNYRQNMFVLERKGPGKFSEIFSTLSCSSSSIPCVDGIRFIPYSEYYSAECYVKNNGIVETCLSLDRHLKSAGEKYPDGYLPWAWLWDRISDICYHYLKSFATDVIWLKTFFNSLYKKIVQFI